MICGRRSALAASGIAALGLWSAAAAAQSRPHVVLVEPLGGSELAARAVHFMVGELTGEGFDVAVVDSAKAVGAPEPGRDPGATRVTVAVDAEGRGAEVRIVDPAAHGPTVRRVTTEPGEAPDMGHLLAVRTVELLHASLREFPDEPPAAAPPAPPPTNPAAPPAAPVVRAPYERSSGWRAPSWGFDAGTAGLVGFGGIGPALLGVIRARLAFRRALQVRITAAGLGTQPRVQGAVGSARVSQELGLVELASGLWVDSLVYPIGSIGVGALRVAADGDASFPYVGEANAAWAFVADAGAGAELRLGPHFDVALEAHAFFTVPSLVTRFLEQTGPGVSQPSLLLTLTVVGWP